MSETNGHDPPGQTENGQNHPIGDRAAQWLHKYLDDAPSAARERTGRQNRVSLFLSNAGEPTALDYLTEVVRGYVEAATLANHGPCPLVRHTMATSMLGGADIHFIQAMLEHSDLKNN